MLESPLCQAIKEGLKDELRHYKLRQQEANLKISGFQSQLAQCDERIKQIETVLTALHELQYI